MNYVGNAAVIGDNKPSFLRAMADSIRNCQEKKIPNCEKLTLTLKIASTLEGTLTLEGTYHSSIIKDLLAEG